VEQESVHLVLVCVRDRPLVVLPGRLGPHPTEHEVREIEEGSDRLVPFAGPVGGLMGVEQRAPVVRIHTAARRPQGYQGMDASRLVAECGRERGRALTPFPRGLEVERQHGQLRYRGTCAGELHGVAVRLEYVDRRPRVLSGELAVAGVPREPRPQAQASPKPLAASERLRDRNGAVDGRQRRGKPISQVRRLRELFEEVRLLGRCQAVREVRGPAVVRERLPVGLGCG
jgi:hypothetical protein